MYVGINDTELVEENGNFMNKSSYAGIKYANVYISDIAYNTLRKLLREGMQLSLRMNNPFPKGTTRSKSRAGLSSSEPILEINKFGYNPALERRIHYKIEQIEGSSKQVYNITYHMEETE